MLREDRSVLANIVTGDESSRLAKSRKRQPSRLPKRIRDRNKKRQIHMVRAEECGALNVGNKVRISAIDIVCH